jgi:hypothetical protein
VNPLRDIAAMDAELMINDLIAVERKQERLAEERKKGGGRDRSLIDREVAVFEKLAVSLGREEPLRLVELSLEEERLLSGFGFLTRKPVLVLLNLTEGQLPPPVEYSYPRSLQVALQGKLEMDISQLAADEAEIFMAEYGIQELGLLKVIHLSYELLGLQSFFTVGEDEVRAWTIRRGANAYEAAGEIHSDLQKGFIRAEVVTFEDLVTLGGLSEARGKGKLRLEGKEYILQDGEIMHVRFNI